MDHTRQAGAENRCKMGRQEEERDYPPLESSSFNRAVADVLTKCHTEAVIYAPSKIKLHIHVRLLQKLSGLNTMAQLANPPTCGTVIP